MVCANTMIICIHNNIAYFPIIFLRTNVHFVVINENISYQKRKFNLNLITDLPKRVQYFLVKIINRAQTCCSRPNRFRKNVKTIFNLCLFTRIYYTNGAYLHFKRHF